MHYIQLTAEKAVRNMLKEVSKRADQATSDGSGRGSRVLRAADAMDDGTPMKLRVEIDAEKGSALFDFTGTGCEVNSILFLKKYFSKKKKYYNLYTGIREL